MAWTGDDAAESPHELVGGQFAGGTPGTVDEHLAEAVGDLVQPQAGEQAWRRERGRVAFDQPAEHAARAAAAVCFMSTALSCRGVQRQPIIRFSGAGRATVHVSRMAAVPPKA